MTAPAEARFVVGEDGAGQRLDAIVSAHLQVSRAEARRLLAAGRVKVDGRRQAKGGVVAAGAVVTIVDQAGEGGAPGGEIASDRGAPVRILFEDDVLLAIDKPGGMPSHPLRPAERGTAANLIVALDPACARASVDPREGGLVHRLDTGTSGVLIAARTRAAWSALRAALAAADCEKSYLAEVDGAPAFDEGRVDAAIGRRGRTGRTVRLDGGRNPQPATTTWRVVERRGTTTLVEARLHAGRAHQVRAHLAGAGLPIVGDDRYGPSMEPRPVGSVGAPSTGGPRPEPLHLHAASVTFRHPSTGAAITIVAPSPAWAQRRKETP